MKKLHPSIQHVNFGSAPSDHTIEMVNKIAEKAFDDVPYPAPKGQVWKTNGMSEWILVDDPERQFLASGKVRRQPTNITPKKKKRKK